MQTGGDHFGIVEYHACSFREKTGELTENFLFHCSVFVMEQFGCIPFRERVFRDPGVFQAVIVILYMDFRNHENLKFVQR